MICSLEIVELLDLFDTFCIKPFNSLVDAAERLSVNLIQFVCVEKLSQTIKTFLGN